MKTGQNCTINWDINQNHFIIKDPGTSNGTNMVEEVLREEKKEKFIEQKTCIRTVCLFHRLYTWFQKGCLLWLAWLSITIKISKLTATK